MIKRTLSLFALGLLVASFGAGSAFAENPGSGIKNDRINDNQAMDSRSPADANRPVSGADSSFSHQRRMDHSSPNTSVDYRDGVSRPRIDGTGYNTPMNTTTPPVSRN